MDMLTVLTWVNVFLGLFSVLLVVAVIELRREADRLLRENTSFRMREKSLLDEKNRLQRQLREQSVNRGQIREEIREEFIKLLGGSE